MRPGSAALVWMLVTLLVGIPKQAKAEAVQSQADFAAAIRDHSTSPFIILLTVIDDRTGQARTGCSLAPFLVGALRSESGLSNIEAEGLALANTSHVFHFSKQTALDHLPFGYADACVAIRHGSSARVQDRTGEIRVFSKEK
jgi:hypothetical protein